jgi:hypothetical protein
LVALVRRNSAVNPITIAGMLEQMMQSGLVTREVKGWKLANPLPVAIFRLFAWSGGLRYAT